MILRFLLLLSLCVGTLAHAQEFLDPAVAFKPSARALDGQTIEVSYEIAKGYYLYRDKFRVVIDSDAATAGTPAMPRGKEKNDENFGKVEVYYKGVTFRVPVERNASGTLRLMFKLTSQGCADAGVCYPPQAQNVILTLPDPATTPSVAASATASSAQSGDESGLIAATLKDAGFWAILAFFFLAGLGLSLTPCVLPMIPILSGIIAGQGHQASHARGFALSLTYVLGMALTYAAAGVAAGLTGTLLSAALQNVWVLGGFAVLFVILSFSMFGFYELQLPTALQSKLSEESGHLQGGRGLGVFLMGALSALIVGPCVAAPLAGALLYIGQTGDAVLGGTALFAMALGMGAPLIAVGVAGGSLLPKAGPWMEGVKKGFGVLLLATAVWLVSPVLPAVMPMLAWAALLIIPAIFLHALDPLPPHAKGWQRFWKGIGIVMLLTGAALLVGALAGNRDPLQPLAGLRGGAIASETKKLPFERVASLAELEQKVMAAGRPVMLDFYADWCVSCKEMEKFTFADAQVQARLAGFTLLKADVTANSADDKALLARFGLFGPPGILFFDASGREIKTIRVVGYQDASRFLQTLSQVPDGV
ncbi:protein-disulfide reductase DsbD [Dechloromonas sp.]|uniref:protein-disulfide reductase DsbD n=1 Tax=Dechloromonas sp. TaxID=1917218 RepID=UPI0012057C32|nr:protein-disulfide reductase DsbD [Dechloromonas sp.]MBU3695258.1 protein-disulfide reductase DsbD [Dechloromonas sp.]TEX47756.1 MAG: thiol:disulfide interchange protein [Rhodocyclaceae bacterium]